MKKLTILLVALIITGCTRIGQIPDQIVYVGEDCTVPLPDYLPRVTATDNCDISTIEQVPEPGTLLNSATPIITVTISATDVFDNSTVISFDVVAVDTIPPTITLDSSMMVYDIDKAGELFKAAHYYTAHNIQQEYNNAPDSALTQYPQLKEWETIWDNYNMVTFFPAGGEGDYFGTFYRPGKYLCECDSTQYYADVTF